MQLGEWKSKKALEVRATPEFFGQLARISRRRFKDLYYEIRNRYFAKYYLLDIKAMPRGACWDCDSRLFHGVFQILVNYVEGEKAHLSKIFLTEDEIDSELLAYAKASRWDRWRNRAHWNERLGMAHLRWEAALDDPNMGTEYINTRQAQDAREVLALYKWYKWEFPVLEKQLNEEEYTGGPCYVGPDDQPTNELRGEEYGSFIRMNALTPEYREWMRDHGDRLEAFEEEITEKTCAVIRLRRGMWT
jgi:hypothetical protein